MKSKTVNLSLTHNSNSEAIRLKSSFFAPLNVVKVRFFNEKSKNNSTYLVFSMHRSPVETGPECWTSPLTKVLDMDKADPVIMETQNTLQLAKYLMRLNYPIGVISQQKLRQLLQKQKGVLGKTNILRIRTLVLKCLLLNGPVLEMRNDLLELEDIVKTVWGQNFKELIPIYVKLMDINLRLGELHAVSFFGNECNRLREFFTGIDEIQLSGIFNDAFAEMFAHSMRF
ncbi:uncharacterized protein TNCV_2588381 [Trichonephila clavipes]|nr:uncharacterized protein TNCV_2588381 [Trichonephila clavipes]